jgi:hypothetical protein
MNAKQAFGKFPKFNLTNVFQNATMLRRQTLIRSLLVPNNRKVCLKAALDVPECH